MGFNTIVIIHNDSLYDIRNDKEFGEKLVDAINTNWAAKTTEDLFAGKNNEICVGKIVDQHHSSNDVIVRFSGNTGRVIRK